MNEMFLPWVKRIVDKIVSFNHSFCSDDSRLPLRCERFHQARKVQQHLRTVFQDNSSSQWIWQLHPDHRCNAKRGSALTSTQSSYSACFSSLPSIVRSLIRN